MSSSPKPSGEISPSTALIWVLALAFFSVGTRNFEMGLSMDAPLYATIARNIAYGGDWFRLKTGIPEFQPFAEHPHLGFWVLGAVFKVLPVGDWSARFAGHFFYVAFLLVFFPFIRRLANERVAALAVILLWSWYLFSNIFSSAHLDPGVLFFGTVSLVAWESALRRKHFLIAAGAGAALALAFLYKGITITGFLPCWAILLGFAVYEEREARPALGLGVSAVAAFVAVCALYVSIVRHNEPDFFQVYWGHQFTSRFAVIWSPLGFFRGEYWGKILQYTYFLAPLGLFALYRHRLRGRALWVPLSLALAFIFLFSTNGLNGGQYLVMVLPWLAWLIADGIDAWIQIPVSRLVRVTAIVAILGVLVAQYLPWRTHSQGPTEDNAEVGVWVKKFGFETLYADGPFGEMPFFWSSRMAWYAGVDVRYFKGEIPAADSKHLLFLHFETPSQAPLLKSAGWCRAARFYSGSLWVPCGFVGEGKERYGDWRYSQSLP